MNTDVNNVEPFLGVSKSFSDRMWVDNLDQERHRQAIAISQRHGLHEIIGRILAGRDVPLDEVPKFIDPKIRDFMPDPMTLRDMDKVCDRIVEAIKRKEKIAVFGDYDVDGATSVALLGRFFRVLGIKPIIYIPDRITEGYGPNTEAIQSFKEQEVTLLITVDCGSSSFEEFELAKEIGLDVVVIDHHQVGEKLVPTAGFVNPNRQDDLSGVEYLSAVGVTYLVVVAINRVLQMSGMYSNGAPNLLEWLDLVALGTVCDVVPLKGLNRAYINTGLVNFRKRKNAGINALCDVSRLNGPVSTYHLGFLLGPRINAGGRLDASSLGTELLLEENPEEAQRMALELDTLNTKRQEIEANAIAEAEVQAQRQLNNNPDTPILIIDSDQWHPGIVGLIASRIRESHRRPSIAIAFDKNDIGKASGRSIDGIDLGACIRSAVEHGILVKGGGHKMAVGLTVERSKIKELNGFIADAIGGKVSEARQNRMLSIDSVIKASSANLELLEKLELSGPYGTGHKEPVLAFSAHQLQYADIIGNGHIKATIVDSTGWKINAISFRSADKPLGQKLLKERGSFLHFAGTLSVNHWQGSKKVQLRIIDAANPKNVTQN